MKDASSIPQEYNPNYEERRKPYLPARQRNGQSAPEKPAGHKAADNQEGADAPAKDGNKQEAAANTNPNAADA